jgi:nucleoside-diphosphate-sugar epimerase
LLSVSSVAYFGGSPADGSPADEASPPLHPLPSRYSATKHAGEQAVRAWAARGLAVDTVYPSLIYGPPGKREGANAILRRILRGRMPAVVGGDRLLSWVFLDDVVEALVRLLRGDAPPGRALLLAGETVRLDELVARVCRLGRVPPPRWRLPLSVARAAAAVAGPLYRLAGRRPPFVPEQLRSLRRHWAFRDDRARAELSWTPRGLDEGLPPTVAFLQAP